MVLVLVIHFGLLRMLNMFYYVPVLCNHTPTTVLIDHRIACVNPGYFEIDTLKQAGFINTIPAVNIMVGHFKVIRIQ